MNRFEKARQRFKHGPTVVPVSAEIARLEAEVAALRGEIDELRADSRRIAELYDLVFERLRDDGAARRSSSA